MYPKFLIFAGFSAAGAMAAPYPMNGTATTLVTRTMTTNATSTVSTVAATAPGMGATAIVLVPGVFEGLGKNGAKEDAVVSTSEVVLTPLKELTHIVDRVSDNVFTVTAFVKQTIEGHARRISEEHDHTIADVVSLPMALLHSLLDHVTAHVRHMCHHRGLLLSELPVGHDANSTAASSASPDVLAVTEKTRKMVTEIGGTAHHLITALGLTHVAEVVDPVVVAAEELMVALEHLTGAGKTGAASPSSKPSGCEECDEDDEDDEECCSNGHSGFRHSIKSKLRGMAVRYLHRHFKSIFRFLLGDLEDIIDDAEQYYDEAYDGPDFASPKKTTPDGRSCDPQALGLLTDHIDKVGEALKLIKSTWRTPEAIEDFFAQKSEEA